jgi:hypothetical protein
MVAKVDNVKLKKCACKLVKYCSVDCQRNHRPLHKRACKKRLAEIRFDALAEEMLANIFSFLPPQVIMRLRRVSKKWSEAARKTIVPLTDFRVSLPNGITQYNIMRVMTTALPNLQQIGICHLGRGNRWSEGEDPDEEDAESTANWTTHDFEIISNFSNLSILHIENARGLNGRYPFLFNSFPLLQKLTIWGCGCLKWDLEMLVGFPLLRELKCIGDNEHLTGNINSLRVLKDTLEKVVMRFCENVEGSLMDLSDFPCLKELDLYETPVTGDIRDIGENDFSSLECLDLPKSVYGGSHEFDRISDAPDLVNTLYLLVKQRPALSLLKEWYGRLCRRSPDWYDSVEDDPYGSYPPPLCIGFVQAGPRIGYRWRTNQIDPCACDVIWLDPEPDVESSDYAIYVDELQQIGSRVDLFNGFERPPEEDEYREIVVPLVSREGLTERYYYEESDEEYDSDIEEW